MIKKIDHIAIVVKDITTTAKDYKDLFGFREISKLASPAGEWKAVMLAAGDVHLELFQPLKPCDIKDFLDKQGGGLYHISFLTDDIVKEIKNVKAKGKKMKHNEPVSLPDAKIAFIDAGCMDNVSIELAERK